MPFQIQRFLLLVLILAAVGLFRFGHAEDVNAADDDAGNNYENAYGWDKDGNPNYQGDDYILYWTEYAIVPKRCIVYNDVDVIVFSVFENGAHHCTDTPVGTYITPVQHYLQGVLDQKQQDMEDQGYEDYELAEVSQYVACTPMEIQNNMYYFQVGCADDSHQALAVNIYQDNTCTTRSAVDGFDDANIDASDIQIKFKKCNACVNWFDRNDDEEVDDAFYENRKTHAPLCSTAWYYKQECGNKCQHTGLESEKAGWSSSEKILLSILGVFGLIMVGMIVRKRQKMSNKDTLLEQAAISAAGLQPPHVIGIFVLVIVIVLVFALLGLKNITWASLLIVNAVLFAYLMKLTIASSVPASETLVGPDGEILQKDSDDSSVDEETERESNRGTYSLPVLN